MQINKSQVTHEALYYEFLSQKTENVQKSHGSRVAITFPFFHGNDCLVLETDTFRFTNWYFPF